MFSWHCSYICKTTVYILLSCFWRTEKNNYFGYIVFQFNQFSGRKNQKFYVTGLCWDTDSNFKFVLWCKPCQVSTVNFCHGFIDVCHGNNAAYLWPWAQRMTLFVINVLMLASPDSCNLRLSFLISQYLDIFFLALQLSLEAGMLPGIGYSLHHQFANLWYPLAMQTVPQPFLLHSTHADHPDNSISLMMAMENCWTRFCWLQTKLVLLMLYWLNEMLHRQWVMEQILGHSRCEDFYWI